MKIEIIRSKHFHENLKKLSSQKNIDIVRNMKTNRVSFEGKPSYRLINHWTKVAIIPDTRETGSEWRRFTFREASWVSIVCDLRKLGFSIENIRKSKEALGIESSPNNLSLFEYYLILSLGELPIYALFFSDGTAELLDEDEFNDTKMLSDLFVQSFIVINLNNIVQRLIYKDYPIPPTFRTVEQLTEEEKNILEMVHNKKIHKIEIQRTDGENVIVKSSEKMNVSEAKIKEMLKDNPFQTITVETQNGNTVSIERTVRRKTRVTRKTGAK